jgi:lipoate-protein ligase B
VPCGITDGGVTSLSRALGRPVAMADAETALVRHLGEVFEREVVESASWREARDVAR